MSPTARRQSAQAPASRHSQKVFRFPARRAAVVWVLEDDDGWLVLAREHGWLHGSHSDAVENAWWLAGNLGFPIREGAP
jgi:hypothetical protein